MPVDLLSPNAQGGFQAHGSVASMLLQSNMDPRVLRPYFGPDNRSYITTTQVQNGKEVAVPMVTNAPATLRRDDWIYIDDAVIRAGRERLRAIADLRARGLTLTIPNGMGKLMLEYETMGSVGPATISMDGIRRSDRDRPVYDFKGLPLPIIHKDFGFTARQIAVSRNSNTPLDTTMAEESSRKVAEEAEKLLLGVTSSYYYGGYTVYGYTNFPDRNTHVLADPTTPGWTPNDTVADVMAMKAKSIADFFYGPWVLYVGTSWDQYLDEDYSAAKGNNTLRERIMQIAGISSIERLDYLTGFQMLLIQMTSNVIRIVIGMDMTTVQWQLHGGMEIEYKVMTIIVPQVRGDTDGNTGIVHGNV